VLKRNPFYLVRPATLLVQLKWRYNKDGIISGHVDRIIITNKHETASSRNEEDAMMLSGDTNSDSSLSEPACFLD
jgi:hypothetical protein